ncbi:MAG TPA: hypothetical protein RMH85_13205 [Polyangiaceae bacterium LLY-WYZ-15_(1-7)]|nr:hypothetical protein [Myxococcales bacterium]MAT25723.1 hypothetical protein [Sandaracinus sp.]HJK93982.1 hypothetical protein [Polyangiaceae bacterium LLY-WYZ-15_(1-7)]MBJ71676.1 hypothetical protein [Sandaracinus sp.]HJK99797.1 hypothetical protein [Polyangiaceae bacterium LLY-WYZ-15_(1-7)]
MLRVAGALSVAGLLCVLLGERAVAQSVDAPSPLESARQAYEQARFEEAVLILGEAEREATLDAEGVARLLELRALSAFGLRDEALVERTLRQLAALDDERPIPDETPPPLRERWEAAREAPPRVELGAVAVTRADDGGLRVRAEASGDLGGLRRGWRIRARVGGGAFMASDGIEVALPSGTGEVEVEVLALGPGGAVVARLTGRRNAPPLPTTPPPITEPDPDRRQRRLVAGTTAAVLVLMAVGIGLSVGLRRDDGSQTTVLEGPFFGEP